MAGKVDDHPDAAHVIHLFVTDQIPASWGSPRSSQNIPGISVHTSYPAGAMWEMLLGSEVRGQGGDGQPLPS